MKTILRRCGEGAKCICVSPGHYHASQGTHHYHDHVERHLYHDPLPEVPKHDRDLMRLLTESVEYEKARQR